MRLRRTTLLALVVALCASGVASADNRVVAKQHYERGTTLYDLGKYLEAAHEYEAAFDAHSDPALLFNIGQAFRLGGDNASATRAYRSYLRRLPDAPNRAEVERLLASLSSEENRPPAPTRTEAPAQPKAEMGEPRPLAQPPASVTVTPPAPTQTSVSKHALEHRPVYKRWWFWTMVGVVVVGGAVTAAVVATTPDNAKAPAGALTISFP